MYVRLSGSKECPFFGKFGMLCFFETTVLRFALLPYYRRIEAWDDGYKCRDNHGNVFGIDSYLNWEIHFKYQSQLVKTKIASNKLP